MTIDDQVIEEVKYIQPATSVASKKFDLKLLSVIQKLRTVTLTTKEATPVFKSTKIRYNFESNGIFILNSALILFFLTITRIGPTLCQGNLLTETFRFKTVMVHQKNFILKFQ